MWLGIAFEVSATHALLGCMLDFQHKQTALLRFLTYVMHPFYSEDFVMTNDKHDKGL